MILERTFQNPNLHLMQLETPRPEQALYQPKELLKALQASPLFDPEHGQWNHYMTENQELKSSERHAHAQLLDLLVLAEIDPTTAKETYEKLKATALYDKVSEQWNVYMNKDQLLQLSSRYAKDQLLDILVLAEFDKKNAAKEAYEKLKDTALYDQEHGQWNSCMNKDQKLQISHRFAYNQLLDILVLAEFDQNSAKQAYEWLKTTALYDKERSLWNWHLNADQQRGSSICSQLLDILVLAEFDPYAARQAYKRLKATPLYDKTRGQWNSYMDKDQELDDSNRYTGDQLLAILVELKLLKLFPPATPLTDETLPLPTVWRGG